MKNRFAFRAISAEVALSLALALAARSTATAQPHSHAPPASVSHSARLEGRSLSVDTASGPLHVPLPCDGRALLVVAERAYVACGARGVVVVRIAPDAPVVEAVLAVAGESVGFFVVEERVWVETTQTTAQPVDRLAGASAPGVAALAAPTPAQRPVPVPPEAPVSAQEPPPERVGRVVHVEDGAVVVDLGAADGLTVGSRVALERAREGTLVDSLDERAVIGEVVATSEHGARVRLGFGESAPEGTSARRADADVTRSLVAPARIVGWSVRFMARPALALEPEGFVIEADAAVRFRGERSYFIEAELHPLAGAVGEVEETGAFAGRVLGGFDHRIFALGLGFGAAHTTIETFDEITFSTLVDGGVHPTIEQHVRVGALDGLHATATNSFARDDRGFGWAQVLAGVQIPAGVRTWLLARGGGGNTRFQWAEVAVRHMIRGNGDHGSLFVTGAAGWTGVDVSTDRSLDFYSGPHVGAGLEWRP